jgi:hypothetical protein
LDEEVINYKFSVLYTQVAYLNHVVKLLTKIITEPIEYRKESATLLRQQVEKATKDFEELILSTSEK